MSDTSHMIEAYGGPDLRADRLRAGLTEVAMAAALGISRMTVRRWEAASELPLLVRYAVTGWRLGLPAEPWRGPLVDRSVRQRAAPPKPFKRGHDPRRFVRAKDV